MKTLISYVAIMLLVVTSSFTIDAQQNLNEKSNTYNCFSYFRTHRQGKGAGMTWAVSSSEIVQFVVERSYDGEFFEPAGSVDFNGASSYKFIDETVYPGYITYRVTAVHADGTTECSPTDQIRIVQRK
jgi:hypothetical protein